MAGQTGKFTRRLESEMRRAADAEEYERAARLRDDIQALQRALEKQAVVLGDGTDCDVIALAEDQLEAAVQVFYVRGGRVRGQRGWVVDKVEEITTGELVEQFLGQVYGEDPVAGEPTGRTAAAADQGPADGTAAAGAEAGGARGGRRAPGGQPGRPVPREVLVPVLPPAPPRSRSGSPRAAAAGSASGSRSGGTRRRCSRPWPGTRGRRWPCTRPSAPAT